VLAVNPAMRAVLEALASATVAGVASALAGDEGSVAIEAARAAMLVAQTAKADGDGAAKFPDFRGGP